MHNNGNVFYTGQSLEQYNTPQVRLSLRP